MVLNIFTLPYIILASPTNSSLESIWEISKIPISQNHLCEKIIITIRKTKLMVYILHLVEEQKSAKEFMEL